MTNAYEQRMIKRMIDETIAIIRCMNSLEELGIECINDEGVKGIKGLNIESPNDLVASIDGLETWSDVMEGWDVDDKSVREWKRFFQDGLIELTDQLIDETL